jgi:hypothetical protein
MYQYGLSYYSPIDLYCFLRKILLYGRREDSLIATKKQLMEAQSEVHHLSKY